MVKTPSKYMTTKEVVAHICDVAERAASANASDDIIVGDWFTIDNPDDRLDGHEFNCVGFKLNASTAEGAEQIPRLIEFRVLAKDFPDLIEQSGNGPYTHGETWAEDARKCQRTKERIDLFPAAEGLVYALAEITAAAKDGKLIVRGHRRGSAKLIIISTEFWDSAHIDPLTFCARSERWSKEDAEEWEEMSFLTGEVSEAWPLTALTAAAEDACREWIQERAQDSETPARPKRDALFADAQDQPFGKGLSRLAFNRAWANAAPPEWKKPGRKPRP